MFLTISRFSLGNTPFYGGGIFHEFILDTPTTILAISGLLLGPYFGLAGLTVKEKSVWVEANRLLHEHISVPFIGGLVLFFGSFPYFSLFFIILVSYGIFVFLATLIGVMATRSHDKAPAPIPT